MVFAYDTWGTISEFRPTALTSIVAPIQVPIQVLEGGHPLGAIGILDVSTNGKRTHSNLLATVAAAFADAVRASPEIRD